MPPFRSRRPSSFQLPPAPNSSPTSEHPSPSPSPPSAIASTSTSASASAGAAATRASSSTRPRSCIITSIYPNTRSRSNTASGNGKPRSPTSPRRTRSHRPSTAPSPYPSPPDSPRSDKAQPSYSPIVPDALLELSRTSSRESLSMSFFNSALNFLAGKLDVEFENDGIVDMLGGANTGTSYSLLGNVIISVPTVPHQMEGRSREIKDLSVVVEGKSEFFDDENGRYTPMRIWTTSIKLASATKPLLIPHVRSTQNRTELAVTFDLAIPGWLPPSHLSTMTQTSYGIVCQAVIGWVEPPSIAGPNSPLIDDFSLHDGPSRNTRAAVRAANAKSSRRVTFDTSLSKFAIHSLNPQTTSKCKSTYREFQIRRHRMPKAMSLGCGPTEPVLRHFSLTPDDGSIPPVECVVSVPEWVDVNATERNLKISMRVRARPRESNKELPEIPRADDPMDGSTTAGPSTRSRTASVGGTRIGAMPRPPSNSDPKAEEVVISRMMELAMEVEEVERWCSKVAPSFLQAYPIPSEQPTGRGSGGYPLINARPVDILDDKPFRGTRTRSCLLADDGSQRNFFFADGGLAMSDRWRKINVVLPMPVDTDKQRQNRPGWELDGPFYRVRHILKIKIVCQSPHAKPEDQVSTPLPRRGGANDGLRLSSSPRLSGSAPAPTHSMTTLASPRYQRTFSSSTRMAISVNATLSLSTPRLPTSRFLQSPSASLRHSPNPPRPLLILHTRSPVGYAHSYRLSLHPPPKPQAWTSTDRRLTAVHPSFRRSSNLKLPRIAE